MDPATTFIIGGTQKAVQSTFSAIIDSVAGRTRAWMELRKLTHNGAEKYADFFARKVGVFPLFATTISAAVDQAFVRVSITDRIDREVYKSRGQLAAELIKQKRGQLAQVVGRPMFPLEAIEASPSGFALIGGPGSGKTTILRHLAMHLAKGGLLRGEERLPIYVAVRDIAPSKASVLDSTANFLAAVGVQEAHRVIQALLETGKLVILLDGLDETGSEHQIALIREIEHLQQAHASAVFVISARPHALSKGMPSFQKWETISFNYEQRLDFAERWFHCVDVEKGKRFIAACNRSPALLDLGSNPLLLSIVCALYYNELDIPKEPNELFSRAVEGMLGGWDNFRNISRNSRLSGLSLQKKILLASAIAYHMFERNHLVFGPDDLASSGVVQLLADRFGTTLPDEMDILLSLTDEYGLLVERSPRVFSFSHLTLHEFLVAKHVVDRRLEMQLLSAHRSNIAWREVIVLVAKMLPSADEYLRYLFWHTGLSAGGDIPLLAQVSSLLPHCDSAMRRSLVHGLAKTLAHQAKHIQGEFTREGNKIILTLPPGNHSPPIIAAINAARKLEARADAEMYEATTELAVKGDRRAKKRAAKKKGVQRPSTAFALFGYLPELSRILRSAEFDIEKGGFSNCSLIRVLVDGEATADLDFEIRQEPRRTAVAENTPDE